MNKHYTNVHIFCFEGDILLLILNKFEMRCVFHGLNFDISEYILHSFTHSKTMKRPIIWSYRPQLSPKSISILQSNIELLCFVSNLIWLRMTYVYVSAHDQMRGNYSQSHLSLLFVCLFFFLGQVGVIFYSTVTYYNYTFSSSQMLRLLG